MTTQPVSADQRPATYFLQEAVDRGFAALEARLDRAQDYRPFFWLGLSPEPGLAHQKWDFGDMCGRYVDAFILGRQVTGNSGYADAEAGLRRLLAACDPYVEPFMAGRVALAFVDQYLQEPTAGRRAQVEGLVRLIRSKMTVEGDTAFYFKPPSGWRSLDRTGGGYEVYPTSPIAGVMLALARYVEAVDAPESEDLLGRLVTFVVRHSHTFEPDGRYYGYTHSGGILTAIAAVLRWALRRGDHATVEHMRNAFDWTLKHSSNWGWVPDGLAPQATSCETCSITDALHAAILLGRHVEPGYFDFVERCARNQLLENQITRPERALPTADFPQREAVVKALHGSWASWSLPNSLDNVFTGVEGCCLGSGIRGCYLVWESVVQKRDDAVFVQLALSRNSPWVEVVGYQPYEGRLDIRIHEAPKLRVRIPAWVRETELQARLDRQVVPPAFFNKRYLGFEGLKRGQVLTITYPLRRETLAEVVADKEYRVRWRGDTVVGIAPQGQRYPLYERDWMERADAPLITGQPYGGQTGGPVHW